MRSLKKIGLVAALAAAPAIAFAADANNPAWQFDIAPYLWAANMNGRVASGPVTAHLSEDFADILNQLNVGGMLWLGAHKGPFGLFLNSMYIVLDDDATVGPINIDEKTRFGLFTAGVSYIVLQKELSHANGAITQLQLEPYVGDRYTVNNVQINLLNFKIKSNHNWQDPIVGLRATYNWPRWALELAGDVGGTNTSTHYSYNLAALVGYKPESPAMKHVTFYVGYRDLYQVYKTGSGIHFFNWNMRQFGPLVGINFGF